MLALVTADAAAGLDPDLEPLARELTARLGDTDVEIVAWDAEVDWSSFDAAIIRSTWDYTERLDEFLRWVERVDGATRLVNGSEAVRWNTDKRYLDHLAGEGVAVTPTVFVAPGEPAPQADGVRVVKPTVGAGSSGARRCRPDEVADHVASLHATGRTAMVQPYLAGLDEHGETALCYVSGPDGLVLSHAFRKGAILAADEVEQVGGLFAKEEIAPRRPTAAELALAEEVLATEAVAALGELAYARVDVAPHGSGGRDDRGSVVLVELELVEPSFYLDTSTGAAERLALAVLAYLARHERIRASGST